MFGVLWLSVVVNQEDMQGSWAVDTFDAGEFDVTGGRGAGDEGDRTRRRSGKLGDAFRDDANDLLGEDDAEVAIRHEGERTASLVRTAVEHDGTGLRDGKGAAGQHAVALVKLLVGEWRVVAQRLNPSAATLWVYQWGPRDGGCRTACKQRQSL